MIIIDKETMKVKEGIDLIDYQDIEGFYEQVGLNTDYIIHPEELLADQFVMVMDENYEVPNPEIIKRMREVLIEFGK